MDKNFRVRLGVAYLVLCLMATAVVVRSAYLMLKPSVRLDTAMKRQFRQDPPRSPRRGYILDRNLEPIAVSMEVKSLFVNPGRVKNKIAIVKNFALILKMSEKTIDSKLSSNKSFVWIKRQLSEEETSKIEKLLAKNPTWSLFIGLSKESKRFYPNQTLAAHLLGFTGLDSRGLEGIELQYDDELMGRKPSADAKDGNTLVLTIDKALQYTLEEELAKGVQETKSVSGSAIILDAESGDILAMGTYPTFNPNQYGKSTADSRRNRALVDTFEPGSTIKPILALIGISNGSINSRTKVFCEYGKYKIGNHWIRESEAKDKWGWLGIEQVLQKSSNVGATKIGDLIGAEKIYQGYVSVGIGSKTEIDLPGESSGSITKPNKWSKILQSNISFGHGFTVNALQIARAYALLANGGELVSPRLVKEIRSFDGELITEISPKVKKRIFNQNIVNKISTMMLSVVGEEGTAPKAQISGFRVAGKTGTAQKPVKGKGYRSGKYIASFAGFVKSVRPNYVIHVVLDEPKFPYHGGEAAAPVFQRIMVASLAREGISSDPSLLIGKSEVKEKIKIKDEVHQIDSGIVKLKTLEYLDDGILMPDLKGYIAKEVLDLFSQKEIRLEIKGSGIVTNQSPKPGSKLERGDLVSVRLTRD
ncbi:MAG: transpeptidase family protein [Oligoflexia bacterium]|nr:transpeptidase family protein [Oligoflexia bacterium]